MEAKTMNELYTGVKPKANCNKCYGRGFIGVEVGNRKKVVCKCLKLAIEKWQIGKLKAEQKLKEEADACNHKDD